MATSEIKKPVTYNNATTSASGLMSATDKSKMDKLTYNNATTSASGLMSATDKSKMDNLPAIKKWISVNPTIGSIANNAEGEATFDVGAQAGSNRIALLRYSAFACVITGAGFSGSKCTIRVRNISGAQHTISPWLLIVEW